MSGSPAQREPLALLESAARASAERAFRAVIDSRGVARKSDIKQFRQACKEVGLTPRERYEASEALHAAKEGLGMQEHMGYGELLAWLRQWKQR